MRSEQEKVCDEASFSDVVDSRVSDIEEESESEGELKETQLLGLYHKQMLKVHKREKCDVSILTPSIRNYYTGTHARSRKTHVLVLT